MDLEAGRKIVAWVKLSLMGFFFIGVQNVIVVSLSPGKLADYLMRLDDRSRNEMRDREGKVITKKESFVVTPEIDSFSLLSQGPF